MDGDRLFPEPSLASRVYQSGLELRCDPNGVFRDPPADVAHLVGAQAALVPHHVRYCLGSWIAAAAGGLGEGFRSGNRREMNSLGEDIMFVFPGRAPAVAGNMSSGRTYNLTDQDYHDILQEAPHVRAVARRCCRVWTFARSATTATPTAKSAACLPTTTDSLPAAVRRTLAEPGRRIAAPPGRCARRRDAEEPVSRAASGRQHHPAERHSLPGDRRGAARGTWRQQFHQQSRLPALQHHARSSSR